MSHIQDYMRLFQGISRLICNSDFDQIEFFKMLRIVLCHQAKKDHPEKSISQLSQMTGIARGVFSENLDKRVPKKTTNKLSSLLQTIWNKRDKNDLIPLKGECSFYELAYQTLTSSYSPETALNELIKHGAVEFASDGFLRVNSIALDVSKDERRSNQVASEAIDRLINTVIENKNKNKARYQNTIWSDKISPCRAKQLNKELFDYFKYDVFIKLQQMFDDAESDCKDKSFDVYGVSVFEFIDK